MSKELLQSYMEYLNRESHPFIEFANTVKQRYCDLHVKYGVGRNDHHNASCMEVEGITDNFVEFWGEETWQFGGHDTYSLNIPIEFFNGTENSFENLESKLKKNQEDYERKRIEDKEARDRKQLAQLKKEYHDE